MRGRLFVTTLAAHNLRNPIRRCQHIVSTLSADRQQIGSAGSHMLASSGAALRQIIDVWPGLSREIRRLVEALCLQRLSCETSQRQRVPGNAEFAEIVTSWTELPTPVKLALISVVRSCLEDSQSLEQGKE